MITIVGYGLGNVGAFANMYKRMNIETRLATRADELEGATKLILPGVGAFDHAMALLDASGMRGRLTELVVGEGVPVLGVCVGMQMLANGSDEGTAAGLGWIDGQVRSLNSRLNAPLPMPHMGWNDVEPRGDGHLFRGLDDARFYFLHSYYFDCSDLQDVAAASHYGLNFACAVARRNVFGVQFHPEKSHHWGAAVLKNFAEA